MVLKLLEGKFFMSFVPKDEFRQTSKRVEKWRSFEENQFRDKMHSFMGVVVINYVLREEIFK